MVHQSAFCKILGISTKIAELTPYHMLGVDPRAFSREGVEDALRERKQRLRQNIPGPQFIPIVALWEKELDAAAQVLLDDEKRRELNERLLREIRDKKMRRAKAKRERLKRAAAKLIEQATDADGALAPERRPALAQRLAGLGLNADQVEALLAEIPAPEQMRVAREEAREYFAKAAAEAAARGPLDSKERRRLMRLADKLGLPREEAEAILRKRKAQTRPSRRPASLADELAAEVDQLAAQTARARLTRAAPRRAPGAADKAREVAAALGLPAEKLSRPLLYKLAAAAIPLAAIGIFALAVTWREGELAPRRPQRRQIEHPPAPTASAETPAAPVRPALDPAVAAVRTNLLAPGLDDEQLQNLLNGVKPKYLLPALQSLMELLCDDSNVVAASLAERAARRIAQARLDGRAQVVVMKGLLAAVRGAADWTRAARLADVVSRRLDLRPLPAPLKPGEALDQLLARWEKEWRASVKRCPNDPLNDPARVAAAALDGGDIDAWAKGADEAARSRVVDALAAAAQGPRAAQAVKLLARIAADPNAAWPRAKRIARDFFVARLRGAQNPGDAKAAYAALADALNLASPPRSSSFASAAGRRALADKLALMIQAEENPAADLPTQGIAAAVSADQIRQAFSNDLSDPKAMLADLALVMLACCDRAMLFAAGQSACAQELAEMTQDPERLPRLTERVTLPEPASAAASTPAPTLGPKQLDALKRSLQSEDDGERYRAIDLLRRADTDEAAAALLAELRRRMAEHAALQIPNPAIATECRILRALGSMRSAAIPPALARLITKVQNSFFCYEITQQLYRLRPDPGRRRNLLLPLKSTTFQRRICQRHWFSVLREPVTMRLWRARPAARPAASARKDEPIQPYPTERKLLAAAAHYAAAEADALKQRKWAREGGAEIAAPPRVILASPRETKALTDALDAGVAQLARLVRAHPGGRRFAADADMIELEHKARTLACRTPLQRAAAALEAQGELLSLLAQETRPNADAERKALLAARDKALQAAPNVLVEMREAAFADLRLFDLLLSPAKEAKP